MGYVLNMQKVFNMSINLAETYRTIKIQGFINDDTSTEVDEEVSRISAFFLPMILCCSLLQVSVSQQSLESSSEEEPTSVSQYFLSDIFTEVEEL